MSRTRWFCHMQRPVATTKAKIDTMSRTLSSVRCSTRLSRSSCETCRNAVAIGAAPWCGSARGALAHRLTLERCLLALRATERGFDLLTLRRAIRVIVVVGVVLAAL